MNTTLQCVLRRFLPVSLVLYERNGYASIKHLTPVSLRPKSLIDSGKKQVKAQSPDKAYVTMRFKLRSVQHSLNLRTKEVCLDKSLCRRPLLLKSSHMTVSIREKCNARFYSRWGGATEHIQLHIHVLGINVNSVSRPLQGKHKPPCIVRFHLLCRAAFFIYSIFFSEVIFIAVIVFYIILFLLIKRSFED